MLVGKCSKCGEMYAEWLLSKQEYQKCPGCGADLIIHNEDSGLIFNDLNSSALTDDDKDA